MQRSVYAIIVTYNGSHWIRQCLDSLLEDISAAHIIVFDNNSTDNTVGLIKKNYPSVQLFPQSNNLGFGRANNLGIKQAIDQGAEYLLLLNQDAWLEAGTLQGMKEVLEANSEIAILSPYQYDGSKTKPDHLFSMYLKKKVDQKNELAIVPFVNAAIWLMPKRTIEIIGGFDPLFPHYGEDVDYVNRCRYRKLKVAIQTKLKGYHDRDSSKTPSLRKRKYFEFINALVELKDINTHLLGSLLAFVIRTLRYFFAAMFKGWLSSAKQDLLTLTKVVWLLPQILVSRKKCAARKNNFLFLN